MTARVVKLSEVLDMLDECLEGYVPKPKEHSIWICMGARIFKKLPKGPGALPRDWRSRAGKIDVEFGHVRSLVAFFEISATCAAGHFTEFAKKAALPNVQ